MSFGQLSLNVIFLAIYTIYCPPGHQSLPKQFEQVLVHTSQPELRTGTGPRTGRTGTELNRKYGSVLSVPVF